MAKVPALRTTGKTNPVVTSRFRGVPVLQDSQGRERYATYRFFEVPFTDEDQYHDVTPGEDGRLDLIAFQYYGSASLDWLIAIANRLPDMIQSVRPGITLRIPSVEWWFSEGGNP